MGRLIETLQKVVEYISGDNSKALRVGGIIITLTLIFICGLSGWLIERLALSYYFGFRFFGSILMTIVMASTIAAGSLRRSVLDVIKDLPEDNNCNEIQLSREKLKQIVGRDVWMLNKKEILRAAAETASENAVDGVFAPLFWMFTGTTLLSLSQDLPGPLTLALVFKATSTIDSMIGYRHGRMKWLGTAGARLDDLLTWLPARAVLLTLPLVSKPLRELPAIVSAAHNDGSKDISPNSGISEAIFAYCADVKMGGTNTYNGKESIKPTLARNSPEATIKSVKKILQLSLKLEIAWLLIFGITSIIILNL